MSNSRKPGEVLNQLYYCASCGTVCVDNRRDHPSGCPTCHVVMEWRILEFFTSGNRTILARDGGPAPHTEEDESTEPASNPPPPRQSIGYPGDAL